MPDEEDPPKKSKDWREELDPELDLPEDLEPDDPDPYGFKDMKWGWEPHSDASLAKIGVRKALEAGTLNLPKAEPRPGPIDEGTAMGAALYRKEVWSSRPREREKQLAENKPYVTSIYPGGGWHCTCPGFGFRRWQKCSHVLAVEEEYRTIVHALPAPSTTALDPYGRPFLVDEDGFEYYLSTQGVKCHRLPVWDRKWGGNFKAYYADMIEKSWESIRKSRGPDFDYTYGGRIYDYRRDSPIKVTTGTWPGTISSPEVTNARPFEIEPSTDTQPLDVGDASVDV